MALAPSVQVLIGVLTDMVAEVLGRQAAERPDNAGVGSEVEEVD
jgi:hypothetical protein